MTPAEREDLTRKIADAIRAVIDESAEELGISRDECWRQIQEHFARAEAKDGKDEKSS